MKTLIATSILFASTLSARAQTCPDYAKQTLQDSTQLVVVSTESWDTPRASLRMWQRKTTKEKWRPVGTALPAVIGSKGAAWGLPYKNLASANQPIKHEGDGKSPAGLFPLGQRFGFTTGDSTRYLEIKDTTVCVDDAASTHYNSIVDAGQTKKDWSSAEEMRKINLYRHGAVINYPSSATEKAGSCIFFHIWSGPDKGTAGCTAVAEDSMDRVQKWLTDESHAAFLVVPKSELTKFISCLPGAASMGAPL